jgi:alpha/beta superfamily hydrolase|tara:strand:+ start:1221 stop:1697 length:477 start_codon:yes stop_codon:yes gene_type:complete
MSLESSELTIGGQTFKGAWIAVVLAIGSTIGGGVWTASSLYSRLEAVEAVQIPNIVPLEEEVLLIKQELEANDVSKLQGKLAELGTNLIVIKDQQSGLLLIKQQVTDVEKSVTEMQTVVQKAEIVVKAVENFEGDIKVLKREIQDLWDGMDELYNPLK